MIFILDTNVISELRRKRPHPAVVAWFGNLDSEHVATTVVTIHEIQRGIERIGQSSPAVAHDVSSRLDGLLASQNPPVLSMDLDAWRRLAKIWR